MGGHGRGADGLHRSRARRGDTERHGGPGRGQTLPPDWAEVLEVAEALDSLPPVTPRGRGGPIDHSGRKQVGRASFYSMSFEGRKMAGGRRFDPNADNAASKTLPFGTTARVTNLENGRSAIVTVEIGGRPSRGGCSM